MRFSGQLPLRRSTLAAGILGALLAAGGAHAQITETGSVTPSIASPTDTTVDGQVTIGDTAAGSATVAGGSTLTVNEIIVPTPTFDGARVQVGNGGTGNFVIDNGTVIISAAPGRTDSARLQISNVPNLNLPAFPGTVTMSNGSLLSVSGDAASIGVGLDGLGNMTVDNSTIGISAAADVASLTVGGSSVTTPQPDVEGHLTLSNNTQVTVTSASATGSTVIGVGRQVNTAGPLVTNTLEILSGTDVFADNTGGGGTVMNIAENGANGAVTVAGGSTLTLANSGAGNASLQVGRDGSGLGSMTVSGIGSSVSVEDFVSVARGGGNGILTVEDNASLHNTAGTGLTRVGQEGGTGTLNVLSGGTYNANNIHLGRNNGSAGTMNVNGAGSTANVADTVVVGRDSGSTGWLNIGDDPATPGIETGGTLNAHTVIVGRNTTSNGTVTLSGAGANLSLSGLAPDTSIPGAFDGASLLVGRNGAGVVNILNGATATVAPGMPSGGGRSGGLTLGGSSSNPTGTGNGTVNVDGFGSTLMLSAANGQAGFTQVGRDGKGTLNITGGGVVDGSAQSTAAVARRSVADGILDGQVNVTGLGSEWRAAGALFMGLDVNLNTQAINGLGGDAALNINDGGTVTVGAAAGAAGGGGNSARLLVGVDQLGIMSVANTTIGIGSSTRSASLTVGGGAAAGPQPGTEGHLTLSDNSQLIMGSGSATSSTIIQVGQQPNTVGPPVTSTLNILSGSDVLMDNTGGGSTVVNVGRGGANGAVTVAGGSTLTLANSGAGNASLQVGRDGSGLGSMTVSGIGSSVSVEDFVSVARGGGNGILTVEDNASLHNTAGTGLTRVGREGGTGTLNVLSGGTYNANNIQVGRDGGSNGTVNVNGAGSAVNAGDTVTVGRDSTGTLNIGDDPATPGVEDGGTVNAHTILVGVNAGSNGTANMSGPGASAFLSGLAPSPSTPGGLDGAQLVAGLNGTGVVNISNGAGVTVAPGVNSGGGISGGMTIGGRRGNPTGTGVGTVNVDGAGSHITLSSANGQAGITQVGRDGKGTLNITGGGLVDGSLQNAAAIARLSLADGILDGNVNVTGTGSEWRAGANLFLGLDVSLSTLAINGAGGDALLNVADGGMVSAGAIVNGAPGTITGGGGTLVGDIANAGVIAPGSNGAGLMSVLGNLDLLGGGTLALEIGGVVFDTGIPQLDYDRIDVADNGATGIAEGIVTIASGAIFDVQLVNSFAVGFGNFFDVVTADSITGDLTQATFLLPALTPDLVWSQRIVSIAGGREALRLAAVPEPATWMIMLIGLAMITLLRLRPARRWHISWHARR